ncbi:MAG: hypothetical protein OQK78_10170 [Gammaproteobacteria bacterium]|nr:hypothetical protein [Gammaproteobacteria bacterium]
MMDKKSLALGIALLAGASAASAEGFGVAVNTGLVGLGVGTGADITYSVHPMVNVRGGFMGGTKSADVTIEANDFAITSKVNTMGVYADWMIFAGDLRLTAGYVTNSGNINLTASGNIDFGGAGTVNTTVDADIDFKASPYVGIGWGNAAEQDDTFGFNVDVGVLLDSKPTATINSAAGASPAQIAALEDELAGDNAMKMLPVITVGLTYHF